MAGDAREFWRTLEARLPREGRGREREIARSVLVLLRHRIRPEEAQHLKQEFPDELKELWATRGVGVAEEHTGREIAEMDHNRFVGWVRDLTELPDMARAAQATEAVFGAVRAVISERESAHVERELPSGLKALWRGDHAPRGPHYEQGASSFWALLNDRLEGRVPAPATDVACSVLAHLRGRLSPGAAGRIRGALPPELREYWVAPEPGAEAEEAPERFWGRIAQDLGTTDMEAARHAARAGLSALRRMLPPDLAEAVARELPEELEGYWEAS